MNLVFLGAPGTGKGTIAAKIAEKHNFTHIAPGNIFREEVKKATPLGKKVKSLIESGTLVPDDLTNQLIKQYVKKNNVFDGYPRTLTQADAVKKLIKIDHVILFDMSEEQIIKRLSGRRTCPNCQAIYHMVTLPPKKTGICDKCGATLVQRKDDAPDVVKHRFRVYQEQTAPLIDLYKKQELLHRITADKSVDDVYAQVHKIAHLKAVK
ncbi:MAG TPA: nucleoside monophosphate kinase [Candidatus Nanoarchaeia archaeon]|nr:nucleoside monophosphate kinase [Candidatus Nanoarchaeia archaeon]